LSSDAKRRPPCEQRCRSESAAPPFEQRRRGNTAACHTLAAKAGADRERPGMLQKGTRQRAKSHSEVPQGADDTHPSSGRRSSTLQKSRTRGGEGRRTKVGMLSPSPQTRPQLCAWAGSAHSRGVHPHLWPCGPRQAAAGQRHGRYWHRRTPRCHTRAIPNDAVPFPSPMIAVASPSSHPMTCSGHHQSSDLVEVGSTCSKQTTIKKLMFNVCLCMPHAWLHMSACRVRLHACVYVCCVCVCVACACVRWCVCVCASVKRIAYLCLHTSYGICVCLCAWSCAWLSVCVHRGHSMCTSSCCVYASCYG
jgi:hypothetical protein